MKKLLSLIFCCMLLCAACAAAEDYSAHTVEELTAIRDAVNAELAVRLEAVKAEAVQSFTSADQFSYVDNGVEVMIRGYNGTATDVVIPAEIGGLPVTRIADSAFKDHTAITSIVIPDSVVEIGANAFYGCRGLQKVELSRNVTDIKPNAFGITTSLTQINLEHVSTIGNNAFIYSGLPGTLVFRAGNLKIDYDAFRYCNSLTGVKIYSDTCEINRAFTYTNGIKFIYVSDGTQLTLSGKLLTDCPAIETFVAPAATAVTYTREDLFSGCPELIIYTPETSGLYTYAKAQFLRCAPAQYEEMSALLDAQQ